MHICIIIVDSLRADHLGCYGYGKETSPHIDEISRKSILFESAITQSNWTLPSLYALISGRYPMVFNISWFDQTINKKFTVLPELLEKTGYYTAIFSNFEILLNPASFAGYFKERGFVELKDNALRIYRKFIGKQKNSLLLFHIGEYVHEPFKAERKYVQHFLDDPETEIHSETIRTLTTISSEDNLRKLMGKINKRLIRINRKELRYLLASYDAGIFCVDKYVGELYSICREMSDDYLFIITADHGQAFLEHSTFGHGVSLYNEVVNVPLILDHNNSLHAKISPPVQHIDLFPTLIDLLGYKRDFDLDGQTYLPLLQGGDANAALEDRIAVSEGYPYVMIRDKNYKLISSYSKFLDSTFVRTYFNSHGRTRSLKKDMIGTLMRYLPDRLYDMKMDNSESTNVWRKRKDSYRALKLKLDRIVTKAMEDRLPPDMVNLDNEIMNQLKMLGYL